VLRGATVDTAGLSARLGVPVEVVYGDLRDPDTLASAVRGIEHGVHAAGVLHVERTRDWYDVNTEGTRELAKASAAAG